MKKLVLFSALISFLFVVFLLTAKESISFAKRWEKVEQLAEKQLPESALKEVEIILAKAKKEKNFEQTIRALLYKMRFIIEKNPDEAPKLLKEFEIVVDQTSNTIEKALLHSMIAELYAQYYQRDLWTINQRTEVIGIIPEDIKEWTKNIYFDKVTHHIAASLKNPTLLQKTDAHSYAMLIDKGLDSKVLRPTMFDFLAHRSIDILRAIDQTTAVKNPLSKTQYFSVATDFVKLAPDTVYAKSIENKIIDIYQQLLTFRLNEPTTEAMISLDLERLAFIRSYNFNTISDSLYLSALTQMQNKYAANEFVVEILAGKANYYAGKVNGLTSRSVGTESDLGFQRKAFDICTDGIRRFPNYKRIAILQNILAGITTKEIRINCNKKTKLGNSLKVNVQSRNVSRMLLKVYKLNTTAIDYLGFEQNSNERKLFLSNVLIESRYIDVQPDKNFGTVTTELSIQSTDYGIYQFTLQDDNITSKENLTIASFTVSDLAFFERSNLPNLRNLYVLDRQSGHYKSDVWVNIYAQSWTGNGYKYSLVQRVKTDKDGLCHFSYHQNSFHFILLLENGNDKFYVSNSSAYFYDRSDVVNKNLRVNLFTDRALYRPGQTVFFKGIAHVSDSTKQELAARSGYDVDLFDANNQKVASKRLTTNEFGSFAGEFVLPPSGLNGAYRLQVKDFSQEIWVEEYKRPSFELTMEKPKAEIQFGDKVLVSGKAKAYAGYAIGGASVKYRVVRRTHHYCWWLSEPEIQVNNGTTTSRSDGSFDISFIAEKKSDTSSRFNDRAYSFTVYAEITDTKGETQQAEQLVSVADKSLFILAEIPNQVDKNKKLCIPIFTKTINDENVKSTLKYSLLRLEESTEFTEKLNDNSICKVIEEVMSGSFETKNSKLELAVQSLKSGRYKMLLTTVDAHGKEVMLERIFVLYDTSEKKPPVKSYVWMLSPKTTFDVNEIAKIQFGTSTQNTFVLYEIMHRNTVLESRWIPFSNEIKTFEIPFEERYGAGINVRFTFMKDEKLFAKSIQLSRRIVKNTLSPTVSVFRNRLQPGEKAEWTVTIPETAKSKKEAELLVGMYDASLDLIRPNSWNFNPSFRESVAYSPSWSVGAFEKTSERIYINGPIKDVYEFQFNQLNWFGLDLGSAYIGGRFGGTLRRGRQMFKEITMSRSDNLNGKDIADVVVGQAQLDNSNSPVGISVKQFDNLEVANFQNSYQGKISGVTPSLKLRTNFDETAFFYPQLRTDALGNVKFSFTAPESLTRWNVKMLAHTKDLYFGQFDTTAITQKELMVQMNLPRFVRRSDKLVLSANVVNLSENDLKADVQFELIDPATNKLIATKTLAPLFLKKGSGSELVSFDLSGFSAYDLVICKVVAQAGNFSDGEQKYLPVLPDMVLITESLPLIIRGNETRKFSFESLIKNAATVDTKNLSIEFSSNPAWYAVQALPTISEPENDNAIDLFAAYYANSLAGFIANSNPKLATMFDRWKNAGGSREALISNLEKNSEFKNILLEETPWVMAAKDETEQKRSIALLFDLNNQKNKRQQYLDKLLELQLPSGGFSWFTGMTESRYVTQEILLNLGRLNRMTRQKLSSSEQLAIKSALRYLDLEIAKDFTQLKKYNKNYLNNNCVSNTQLFYLHMRSEYPQIEVDQSALDAVKFYTAQSEKHWTSFTLYGKAMMAVVAQRKGNTQLAAHIHKSLEENALKTDELGMYWAKNTSGYFWNERPISVQAAIIEAFSEISNNTPDIDEMKIWLLKQKQTQCWDSPTATVDAIYSLLNNGSNWLANDGSVEIKVGNSILKPESTEAGTGYFKQSLPIKSITSETGKITVAKRNTGIGWGAMYWNFFQDLDKVTGQSGALTVSKKLFVEKVTSTGKTILPIEQTNLKKGDRITTRLVVTTDRDLEFVALKDLRAACFEPVNQLSGCEWKEGICYYQTTKDASTQFFFSFLPKGTYVFEYQLWVNNSGEFTSGITTIQCQYAPEFISHTGGERIVVK